MKHPSLFARSRRRIIAAIMAVLVALFAATLAVIYAFSYVEVYDRNARELEAYAANYQAGHVPFGSQPQAEGDQAPPVDAKGDLQRGPGRETEPRRAPFYAVLFDGTGGVAAVDNLHEDGYDDADLVTFAEAALATGRSVGQEGPFLFAAQRGQGYALVAFMDNTLVSESMGTLFRYTLIVGLVALVALFFVARWLAGRIVRPMEEAYEAQTRFIADAGHELKTPVAVVEANAELLQRQAGPSQWLDNIRYENGRMGALVNQLLDLARTEQGDPVREPVDLSRVVEREALSYQSIAFEKERDFSWSIAEGLEVKGDAPELAKLPSILLDNAFEHGVPDGPVVLSLVRHDREARLTVTNGIEPDQVNALRETALFDRFARADAARSNSDDAPTHYGLGLAIARAIAEAHGGSIDAAIDAQAATIAFTVTLPLKKQ